MCFSARGQIINKHLTIFGVRSASSAHPAISDVHLSRYTRRSNNAPQTYPGGQKTSHQRIKKGERMRVQEEGKEGVRGTEVTMDESAGRTNQRYTCTRDTLQGAEKVRSLALRFQCNQGQVCACKLSRYSRFPPLVARKSHPSASERFRSLPLLSRRNWWSFYVTGLCRVTVVPSNVALSRQP